MPTSLPPLAALRAFEAAARLQSVSRAADALHVTHGAISRHVRSLEQLLGTALFTRQGRGLVLTAAGTRLRDATSEGFALIADTWADLASPRNEAPLVLGCSGSLLARWVIPRLGRLQRDLPDLRVHLSANEQPPGPDLDGLDAALLLDTPPWPGDWQVHELGVEWIGLCSARKARWRPSWPGSRRTHCWRTRCCIPVHARKPGRTGRRRMASRPTACASALSSSI